MNNLDEMEIKRMNGLSIRKLLPLLLIVFCFAAYFLFDLGRFLSFQALSDNRDMLVSFVDRHYLTALLLYFLFYTVSVAASFPGGLLMTLCGGFLFGWIVAGSVTVVAATLGATALFMIASTSLGEPLRAKAGPRLAKLEKGFQENALNYLLFLRLVPAFPFWLVNIAPAFLGVPLSTYVIGTFVGIIPGTFVFAFLGGGLDSIIIEQQGKYAACLAEKADSAASADASVLCSMDFELSSLMTGEIIASFVGLGVISLIPVIWKKYTKTRP